MALSTQPYKGPPLFISENELTDDQYVLRNLTAGIKEKYSHTFIVSMAKDYRQK